MPNHKILPDIFMPIGKVKTTETESNQGIISDYELVEPKYSMDDVLGTESLRKEIRSIISLKRHSNTVYEDMGFFSTHPFHRKFVVNFYGPPGTGKTITAHAIAKEFSKKLLIVDYSQLESKYVGDTPKNIKKLFDFAKKVDCLVFFDEADAILSKRVTNMSSSTDTSVNQTRSVLLNILNEFQGDLIFATNFISNYDSAFMRRIMKHVEFSLPDEAVRLSLLKKYTPNQLYSGIDFCLLAKESDGLSAADIENALLMSAFTAASSNRIFIKNDDILDEIKSIRISKQVAQGSPTDTPIITSTS